MELRDTIRMMCSADYKERFCAEYWQTKIRYEKLKTFNTRIDAAMRTQCTDNPVEEPKHDCPAALLREQQAAKGEYLHILELRAVIEGVDLQADEVRESKDVGERSGCLDCVHVPICKYLADNLPEFKLPSETSGCDMFESVNGWGEERDHK